MPICKESTAAGKVGVTCVSSQQGIRYPAGAILPAWRHTAAVISLLIQYCACSSIARTWGSRQMVLRVQGKDWRRKQGLELQLEFL